MYAPTYYEHTQLGSGADRMTWSFGACFVTFGLIAGVGFLIARDNRRRY